MRQYKDVKNGNNMAFGKRFTRDHTGDRSVLNPAIIFTQRGWHGQDSDQTNKTPIINSYRFDIENNVI